MQYCHKGDSLYLEGRLQFDQWDDKQQRSESGRSTSSSSRTSSSSAARAVAARARAAEAVEYNSGGGGQWTPDGRRTSLGRRLPTSGAPTTSADGGNDGGSSGGGNDPHSVLTLTMPIPSRGISNLPGGRSFDRSVHQLRDRTMAKTSEEDDQRQAEGKEASREEGTRSQPSQEGPHGGTLVVLVDDTAARRQAGRSGRGEARLRPQLPHPLRQGGRSCRRKPRRRSNSTRSRSRRLAKRGRGPEGARGTALTLCRRSPSKPTPTNRRWSAAGRPKRHWLLYGSIGPAEISKTLKGKNLKVEPEMVKLENPIKEANTLTEVPLSLGYGIEAKIQVLVVASQAKK